MLVADTMLQRNWCYIFLMATLFTICLFPPFPLPSFILSQANNSFSFCHCDVAGILGFLFVPDSIYKKCMIFATSPFDVREELMIHIHSLCSFEVYLYVITVSSVYIYTYRVRINYRRVSLHHNLSRKCRKIVKFLSITHSERNMWNGPIVAAAISRKKA